MSDKPRTIRHSAPTPDSVGVRLGRSKSRQICLLSIEDSYFALTFIYLALIYSVLENPVKANEKVFIYGNRW